MDKNKERQLLMDHYTKPTNFGFINNESLYKKKLKSDSCSDELIIQILEEDNVIKDIKFEGSACVISTSSSDILFTILKNKNLNETIKIVNDYNLMINEGAEPTDLIQELYIFKNIYNQKNRKKCATLGSNGILEYIKNKK